MQERTLFAFIYVFRCVRDYEKMDCRLKPSKEYANLFNAMIKNNCSWHVAIFCFDDYFLTCELCNNTFLQGEIASSASPRSFYDTCDINSIMFPNRITCLVTKLTFPLKSV